MTDLVDRAAVREMWQHPDSAPDDTEVIVWTRGGDVLKAIYQHCGDGEWAWVATNEAEYPGSWTDGRCWEVNADSEESDPPILWTALPSPPAQATAEKGMTTSLPATLDPRINGPVENVRASTYVPTSEPPSPLTARVTARLTAEVLRDASEAAERAARNRNTNGGVYYSGKAALDVLRAAILAAIQPELQDAERRLGILKAELLAVQGEMLDEHERANVAERRLREAEGREAAVRSLCAISAQSTQGSGLATSILKIVCDEKTNSDS